MDAKKAVAEKAVELIEEGMTVGLGSGSTAALAIERLGEKVKQGLNIRAVASSRKSEELARKLSIPVFDPSAIDVIDIAIDGADEADTRGNLIKGGGGSLLREKIIAFASRQFHVMVDDSKLVEVLGRFPLPVELTPFAAGLTLKHITALGAEPVIRNAGAQPFISDNGNLIADCRFPSIADPAWLDVKLRMIPGVVETGLFSARVVTSILVGYANGEVKQVMVNP
jgi:ribose 5-phosphate isomerase A